MVFSRKLNKSIHYSQLNFLMLYKNNQLIQDLLRYQYVKLFEIEDLNQMKFFRYYSEERILPIRFVLRKK